MIFEILLSTILSYSFIFSLYIWRDNRSRDDPILVKKRFISVLLVCILSLFSTKYFGYELKGFEFKGFFNGILSFLFLFHIPIIEELISRDKTIEFNLYEFRALVVGPVGEEIVYRLCLYSILRDYHFLIISSLLFSFSHLHHFYEHIKTYEMERVVKILLFQLFYTFLFSICSGHLMVKYENVFVCILFHSFCNFIGFPSFKVILIPFYVLGIYLFINF